MFADYHVHTEFSDDSVYPMEEVIRDALDMRMDEICFTDHVDYGIKTDWDCGTEIKYQKGGPGEPSLLPLVNVDYPRYYDSIRRLQDKYAGRIKIRFGLEFGMQVQTIHKYEELFKRYPFDFIILSVHEIGNKELWTQDFQRGLTQRQYNERYYLELLQLVREYHDYSVLGHLDLITRYDMAGTYKFDGVRPLVSEILRTVIDDGKGIEINTSSYRYGLRDLTPSTDILKMYRELGGRIITIGSDSHKKEHLGAHITEVKRKLAEIGFCTFCTYDKMKPEFHDIALL